MLENKTKIYNLNDNSIMRDIDFDPQASYSATDPEIKRLMHHSGV